MVQFKFLNTIFSFKLLKFVKVSEILESFDFQLGKKSLFKNNDEGFFTVLTCLWNSMELISKIS